MRGGTHQFELPAQLSLLGEDFRVQILEQGTFSKYLPLLMEKLIQRQVHALPVKPGKDLTGYWQSQAFNWSLQVTYTVGKQKIGYYTGAKKK